MYCRPVGTCRAISHVTSFFASHSNLETAFFYSISWWSHSPSIRCRKRPRLARISFSHITTILCVCGSRKRNTLSWSRGRLFLLSWPSQPHSRYSNCHPGINGRMVARRCDHWNDFRSSAIYSNPDVYGWTIIMRMIEMDKPIGLKSKA